MQAIENAGLAAMHPALCLLYTGPFPTAVPLAVILGWKGG